MLDLAGPDAEGERADPAVAGGVAVAADDRRAGQRKALFRPNDMADTLFGRERVDIPDAIVRRVFFQPPKSSRDSRLGDQSRFAPRITLRVARSLMAGTATRQD